MGLLRLDPRDLTAEALDAALCVVQARCLEMGVAPSSNWAQRFLTEINLRRSRARIALSNRSSCCGVARDRCVRLVRRWCSATLVAATTVTVTTSALRAHGDY